MNIALIGPSGVGKGTHADRLIERYGFTHVSTGDLFRRNLEELTALGIMARKYMDAGELVPDEVTEAMMEAWLRGTAADAQVLFDGFPRTVYQAEFLDGLLNETDNELTAAIYLEVSDDIIVERLAGRLICPGCQATFHRSLRPPERDGICDRCGCELFERPDDRADMVQTRLRVFHRATAPLFDYFQSSGRLVIVDGEGDPDAVAEQLIAAVEATLRGQAAVPDAADIARLKAVIPPPVVATTPERARLDLVLLGGPGSGKGTQAEKLRDALALPHVATGDLFRENLRNETDLGQLAKTYMDRGELVPDDVTEAMVAERLERADTAEGFILDGFPRTLPQAQALDDMLAQSGRRLAGVLYIDVSDEEIVRRLSGRMICRECQTPFHSVFKPPAKANICDRCGGELYRRDDDNPDTIRQRLKTFHGQTAPLADYYQASELLHRIEGEGPPDTVIERSLAAAEALQRSRTSNQNP